MSESNGEIKHCAVGEDWKQFRREIKLTMDNVNDTYIVMQQMVENSKHLSKLDGILTAIGGVEVAILGMKDGLLGPATGKDQLSTKTFEMVMNHLQRNTKIIYGILCSVILVLLFVIGFLLTGEKFEFIRKLFG